MAELTAAQRLENLLITANDVVLMMFGNLQDAKLVNLPSLDDATIEANFRALSQIFDDFVRLRGTTQQIRDSLTTASQLTR